MLPPKIHTTTSDRQRHTALCRGEPLPPRSPCWARASHRSLAKDSRIPIVTDAIHFPKPCRVPCACLRFSSRVGSALEVCEWQYFVRTGGFWNSR